MICPSPLGIKVERESARRAEIISVPCGKCGACRHNRRSMWSFRLKQELKVSVSAFFITITYDDDHLKYSSSGIMTLCKEDLQKFIKRVRKEQSIHTDVKVRYYAVGEYGENTYRPHYHILFFNLSDKTVKKLDKLWDFGLYHIGHVTEASIHYVTKHHVNAKKDKKAEKEMEFATMSNRTGIGKNYIEKNEKWHRENQNNYIINNGYKQAMPRYYKNKIFTESERKLQAEKLEKELDKKHNKKVDELKDIGYDNPEKEIHQRELRKAAKVKDKSQRDEKNLF